MCLHARLDSLNTTSDSSCVSLLPVDTRCKVSVTQEMEADTPGLGAEPSQKNASKSPDDQVQDKAFQILEGLGSLVAELFRVRSLQLRRCWS